MYTIIIAALVSFGWLGVSFLMEPLFPIGDIRWGVFAGLCFAGAGIVFVHWRWKLKKEREAPKRDARVQGFSDFDMPIETAIEHIVDSTHHTFTRSSLAERNAFAQLHTAMCSGRLPVIGREGEATTPRKISRCRCKKLDCIEMATPQGIRFQLIDREQNERIAKGLKALRERSITRFEESAPIGFSELRVRSKDVYGIWPRNMEGGA